MYRPRLPQLRECDLAAIIVSELRLERHAVQVEYVRPRQIPRAVHPIGAVIRRMAGLGRTDGRLGGLVQIPLGDKEKLLHLAALFIDGFRNVGDTKKPVELKLTVEHVLVVYDDDVCARDGDSAVLQHVFLIRHVRGVDLPLAVSGALDLVYRPAAVLLFEYVDGAVEPVIRERRLADYRRAAIHLGLRRIDHLRKIEPFAVVRGHLDKITEQPHRKIADLAARFHSGKRRFIQGLKLRLVF